MESLPVELVRDVEKICLPRWGRVCEVDDIVPWWFVDDAGVPVEPVQRFLRELIARKRSRGTVRSYAYDLQRWWRFLIAVDVPWDTATSADLRDFVLWLLHVQKPSAQRRTASAATAGTVNPITRKQYPGDRFGPATIAHSNAVLRSFYEFWIEQGAGPLVNPVPRERVRGGRPHGHHNPVRPFVPEGRLRYNPPRPKRRPRAMSDELWLNLFAAMPSNRDRAILALDISNGARAAELLGLCGADVDWGHQLIQVRRKGSGAQQWLPASPDAFVWLRLYYSEAGTPGPAEAVWRTLRRRRHAGGELEYQRLNYDAWRAVLRRANAKLGTNWTMHDLRHTCAIRMLRDKQLTLRDIQTILGHAHLTTTEVYLIEDDQQVIARVREHHARREAEPPAARPPTPAAEYAAADLAVLFGG
ncbi:tyrosine-type recombinase/integrase [Nocardia beijingensis]